MPKKLFGLGQWRLLNELIRRLITACKRLQVMKHYGHAVRLTLNRNQDLMKSDITDRKKEFNFYRIHARKLHLIELQICNYNLPNACIISEKFSQLANVVVEISARRGRAPHFRAAAKARARGSCHEKIAHPKTK